jgi:GH25 family lysozyme M1 (1,4-beta-N-acetylmuramidase)
VWQYSGSGTLWGVTANEDVDRLATTGLALISVP